MEEVDPSAISISEATVVPRKKSHIPRNLPAKFDHPRLSLLPAIAKLALAIFETFPRLIELLLEPEVCFPGSAKVVLFPCPAEGGNPIVPVGVEFQSGVLLLFSQVAAVVELLGDVLPALPSHLQNHWQPNP